MKKLSHCWQKRLLIMMSVSAFALFAVPFLLPVFPHPLDKPGFAEGLLRIIGLRPVRIGLSLLIQVCLQLFLFTAEKIETNRTMRMRLRAAGSIVLILAVACLILNLLPFSIQDGIYYYVRSFEFEYGFSGLIFFSALLLYIIVFKLLNLSPLG